jgi:2-octaprenyl-6-methoxyphenol hydroxylase
MDNPYPAPISNRMTKDTDIAIIGGGLNGPALALALVQAGQDVTLIDAAPQPVTGGASFDGRAYALALASTRLLQALDVWPEIEEQAQPILEIRVTDGRAGEGPSPFFMHFDHAEIEEGPMGHMVEDRRLRPALMRAVEEEPQITLRRGNTVVAQQPDATGINPSIGRNPARRVGRGGRWPRIRHGTARCHPPHRLELQPDGAGLCDRT